MNIAFCSNLVLREIQTQRHGLTGFSPSVNAANTASHEDRNASSVRNYHCSWHSQSSIQTLQEHSGGCNEMRNLTNVFVPAFDKWFEAPFSKTKAGYEFGGMNGNIGLQSCHDQPASFEDILVWGETVLRHLHGWERKAGLSLMFSWPQFLDVPTTLALVDSILCKSNARHRLGQETFHCSGTKQEKRAAWRQSAMCKTTQKATEIFESLWTNLDWLTNVDASFNYADCGWGCTIFSNNGLHIHRSTWRTNKISE